MNLLKKVKKPDKPEANGLDVHIIIKRIFAENTYSTVAEFDAKQTKDDDNNLIILNEKLRFKHSVNFETAEHIVRLRLKLAGMDESTSLNEIKKAIKLQNERLKLIESGYLFSSVGDRDTFMSCTDEKTKDDISKAEVNIIDERTKLNNLEILQDKIKFGSEGSFEELNIGNQRQITFLSKGGLLYPIFHNTNKHDDHADFSVTKKLFYEYDDRNNNWLANQKKSEQVWNNIFKVILVVLIGINIFAFVRNLESSQQNTAIAQESSKFLDESYLKEFVEQNKGEGVECAWYYMQLMKEDGAELMHIRETLSNMTLDALTKEINSKEKLKEIADFTNNIKS